MNIYIPEFLLWAVGGIATIITLSFLGLSILGLYLLLNTKK